MLTTFMKRFFVIAGFPVRVVFVLLGTIFWLIYRFLDPTGPELEWVWSEVWDILLGR